MVQGNFDFPPGGWAAGGADLQGGKNCPRDWQLFLGFFSISLQHTLLAAKQIIPRVSPLF